MTESAFVKHVPCDHCGSSDAGGVYTDGHFYCHKCHTYETNKEDTVHLSKKPRQSDGFNIVGEFRDLPARQITEETCRFWSYRYGKVSDKPAQIAYYLDDQRRPVAAKVRFPDKTFTWLGDPNKAGLYGQWLWPQGGKKIVICEGEIDTLTVSQLQDNRWPCVSIPNGAQGAAKSIKKHLDWLNTFESIVFMFDMDEPGLKAARECAELFPPGKAKIAKLPLKDANECLVAGRGPDVLRSMWNADPYRPDGIVCGTDLWPTLTANDNVESIDYPWSFLNEKTHGIRTSELVCLTAGSGIGKSAVVTEIAYSLIQRGEKVGMIMLEENIKTTSYRLMGLHLNKRLTLSREGVSDEDFKLAFDATLGSGNVFLFDHFGSTQVERLLSRIRHLAKGLDCKYIFLDHLSILVSSMEEAGNDERKLIDRTMTLLRTLVQETGISLFVVSHLKRPEGLRGFENGQQVSLNALRGSHAIAQLSDMVLALERDQQSDNPNETTIRVLKNRFSGEVGEAGKVYYDKDTGRLTEVPTLSGAF